MDFTTLLNGAGSELFLAIAGLVGLTLGAIFRDSFITLSYRLAAFTLFIAAFIAVLTYEGGSAFNDLIVSSPFTNYIKIFCYSLAGLALLISDGFMSRHKTRRYEYPILFIFSALGMGLILSSANLMTLYMGIEILGLSSYILAAFNRDSPRSSEAGLKYFVLGALASGLLLYGASLIYGYSGSASYRDIAEFASSEDVSVGFIFGLVLMISGLAFKVSAAPMHVWTPDVYEGAPTPVVAFFATAPKFAGMGVFAIILFTVFGSLIEDWQLILVIIATLSMLIGAFGALAQTNIKRLLAYSSIANIGYATIALSVGMELGASPLLLFMTIYALTSLGLFAGVLAMRRSGGMVEDINELSGLYKAHPGLALGLTLLLVSIAGLPPLGGFWPKLRLLQISIEADFLWLAIVLVLSSVIAAAYYLRIIHVIWFKPALEAFEPVDRSVRLIVLVASLAAIGFLIWIGQIEALTDAAASSLS